MKFLESKGASYNKKSVFGFTPIHSAIESDAILALAYMFYCKKLNFEEEINDGKTPLLYSIFLK